MADNHDIFAMLDQASIFSSGRPRNVRTNQLETRKEKEAKLKKENHNKKVSGRTAEEKEYAAYVGYEASDNSDDDYLYDDFDHFDDETVENTISKRQPYRQHKNNGINNLNVQPSGFGLGRGRILCDYKNTLPSKMGGVKSQARPQRNRQEQNDRIISGQLREIVGVGISNEEIEDAFAKKFANNNIEASVIKESEDYSKKDFDTLSTTSVDSKRSSKSSKHSDKEIYVPPALRRAVKGEQALAETKKSAEYENCLPVEKPYVALPPVSFGTSAIKLTASKVPCIYEDFMQSNEQDDKENVNNFSSDEDVEIVSVVENCNEEKPIFGFNIKDKKNFGNSAKSKGGRNALINGLLKRNKELGEPDVDGKKEGDNLKGKLCEEGKKLSYNFISDSFNRLEKNIKDENSSAVIDKYEWQGKIDNSSVDGRNISTSSSNSPSRYSDVSNLTNNCSKNSNSPIKTYTELITDRTLENKRKPQNTLGNYLAPESVTAKSLTNSRILRSTLGDYLSSDSLNSSEGINSVLNPDAPLFTPNFNSSKSQNSYDFKLDDTNFPPL